MVTMETWYQFMFRLLFCERSVRRIADSYTQQVSNGDRNKTSDRYHVCSTPPEILRLNDGDALSQTQNLGIYPHRK